MGPVSVFTVWELPMPTGRSHTENGPETHTSKPDTRAYKHSDYSLQRTKVPLERHAKDSKVRASPLELW